MRGRPHPNERGSPKRVALANGADAIGFLNFYCIDGWYTQEYESELIRFDKAHLRIEYAKDRVTYLDRTVVP